MQILAALNGTFLAPRGGYVWRKASDITQKLQDHYDWCPTTKSLLRSLHNGVVRSEYYKRRFNGIHWDKISQLAEKHGSAIRDIAAKHSVAKDPQFTWTLPVWLEAGAAVDAVVVSLRSIPAMVQSRIDAEMMSDAGRRSAEDNFAYGLGILMSTMALQNVPYSILNFPQFLDDPAELYGKLPLPDYRSWEEFRVAFDQVVDRSLVHHWGDTSRTQ
jgi:hypothetical protein